MKPLSVIAIALSLFVAGCSDDSSTPNNPSPSTNPIFTAALSPANEVPPVTNAESTVSGNATITLNTTRDSAGNVTSASATFAVTLGGFPAGSNITAAHIHEGASTCACPVVVNTTVGLGTGDDYEQPRIVHPREHPGDRRSREPRSSPTLPASTSTSTRR